MPKSVIFSVSVLGSYMRFAGLMSRWTTCCLCANPSASAVRAIISQHFARLQQVVGLRIVAQMPTLQILHGDVGEPALLADIVDGHDVRMIEPAGGFGLAKKTRPGLDEFGVAEFAGQWNRLDRHHAVDGGITARGKPLPWRRGRFRARAGIGRGAADRVRADSSGGCAAVARLPAARAGRARGIGGGLQERVGAALGLARSASISRRSRAATSR